MRRLLCDRLPESGESVALDEGEARHATQVLRLREGDEIELLDGAGAKLRARLILRKGRPYAEHAGGEPERADPGETLPFDLALGILKGDAMEWAIEKCVELGVRSLRPLACDRSVVQVRSKGEEEFRERWQRIADQALKQCGRLTRLHVSLPAPFESALVSRPEGSFTFLADERGAGTEPLPSLSSSLEKAGNAPGALVLVGPEGGWSDRERALFHGFAARDPHRALRVSLGPLVLRAETAALFASSVARACLHVRN